MFSPAGVCEVPAMFLSAVSPKAIPITINFMADSLVQARLAARRHSESGLNGSAGCRTIQSIMQANTWRHQHMENHAGTCNIYSLREQTKQCLFSFSLDFLEKRGSPLPTPAHPPRRRRGVGLGSHCHIRTSSYHLVFSYVSNTN